MQSAIAAAATISTVAVGATATVTTSAAHGYANGDYVLITANGMRQIDGRSLMCPPPPDQLRARR